MQSVILTTGLELNLKSKKKTKKMGKEFQINVAALKSQLLQRRSTRPRFKWDFTKDAAADILLAAYMAEVEHRGREFVDDPRLRVCIAKTANHVTEGKKFGLMFCGTCGNGKTTLLLALRAATNYLNSCKLLDPEMQLRIYDAKDIAQMSSDWDKFKTIRSVPVLAIEDMGREPAEVMSYGNITNPLVDLLEYRYAELLPTIITTNLTAKQIREKYGVRIADRFNEMIDVVIFQSGSYRK